MMNLLILFGPESAANKVIVDSVKAAFAAFDFKPVAKKASNSSIVDIASSDMVLFGAEKSSDSAPIPDFAEILRVCRGVNLAGKTAGFFALGAQKISAGFHASLRESDLSFFEGEPDLSELGDGRDARVREWARQVSVFHARTSHGGK